MTTTAGERASVQRTTRRRALFERLARRSYAGVYNYLCWISRDPRLAEDLTQETFLQVWRRPPEAQGGPALRAWIYKVARNQFLQHRRRPALDEVAFDSCPEADTVDPAAADPHLELERSRLRDRVRFAVDRLPAPYREVIVLHNLEGLSLAQVAEVLDIPTGTVKSRRARAFAMLRRFLHEEAHHEI